jgi:hypothetical protein
MRTKLTKRSSVADPGCLSRIPDPDFYPSRISDPGSRNSNKKEGRKKICCHNFLCTHKFHKIVNYFSFDVLKKKIWANFIRIIEPFTQKMSTSSQKYGFGIPDPGVKKAPDPGSGSATLKRRPGFCDMSTAVLYPCTEKEPMPKIETVPLTLS